MEVINHHIDIIKLNTRRKLIDDINVIPQLFEKNEQKAL